jgi:hypothetical protein
VIDSSATGSIGGDGSCDDSNSVTSDSGHDSSGGDDSSVVGEESVTSSSGQSSSNVVEKARSSCAEAEKKRKEPPPSDSSSTSSSSSTAITSKPPGGGDISAGGGEDGEPFVVVRRSDTHNTTANSGATGLTPDSTTPVTGDDPVDTSRIVSPDDVSCSYANKKQTGLSIKDSVLRSTPNSYKLARVERLSVITVDAATIAASFAIKTTSGGRPILSVEEGEMYKGRRARTERNVIQNRLTKSKEVEESRSKKYAESSSSSAPSAAVIALSKKIDKSKKSFGKFLQSREDNRRAAAKRAEKTTNKKAVGSGSGSSGASSSASTSDFSGDIVLPTLVDELPPALHDDIASVISGAVTAPIELASVTVDKAAKKTKNIKVDTYDAVLKNFDALKEKASVAAGVVEPVVKYYDSGRAQRTAPMPRLKYRVAALDMLPTMQQSLTKKTGYASSKKVKAVPKPVTTGLSEYAMRVTECASQFRKQVQLFNSKYKLLESSEDLRTNLVIRCKQYYGKTMVDFKDPRLKPLVDVLDLEDPEHFGHGVDVLGDGTCWVTSIEQSLASMAVACNMNEIKASLMAMLMVEINTATFDDVPTLSALSRFQLMRFADPDLKRGENFDEILVSSSRDTEQYLAAVAHYTAHVQGLMDDESAWLDELGMIYLPRVLGRDIHLYSTVCLTETWMVFYANSARTPSILSPLYWISNGKHFVPLIKNRDLIENWSPLDAFGDEDGEKGDIEVEGGAGDDDDWTEGVELN